jgi:hypothetical protein
MILISVLSFASLTRFRSSPFESYTGHWLPPQRKAPGPNQDMRLYIAWPKNLSGVHPVEAIVYYMYPPFTRLPRDPFLTSGYWVKKHNLMFLFYSPEPVVQIQTSLDQHVKTLAEVLSSADNFTHEQFHTEVLQLYTHRTAADHVVTFVFSRRCSRLNHTCYINGTQMRRAEKHIFRLQQYDFIEGQKRWRSMLGVCGCAITLMYFSLLHDRPRWSDISPHSIALCSAGEYATDLLFYVHRESFDLGSSFGFGFLAFFAFWIPFDFLGIRFERASAQNTQSYRVSWFIRWVLVGALLSGLVSYPKLTFILRFAYWIPQIAFSAIENHRKSVNMRFALLFSVGQMLFTAAIVGYHPMYDRTVIQFMKPITLFMGVQLFAIWLQNTFGGAFFLPLRLRNDQYDYRGEKPPQNTECVVCLNEIGENEAFLATPCHHHFHDNCLRTWMEEQTSCPICRAVLPPLDIEPPDA